MFGSEIISRAFNPKLSPESLLNLEQTVQSLEEDRNLSLIIYFNHITLSDGPLAFWLYRKYIDPKLERNSIVPAAYGHMNKKKDPVISRLAPIGSYVLDLNFIPVVRSYDEGVDDDLAFSSHIELLRNIKKQIPCDLLIAPEGHRSDTGEMQKGEMGLVKLARLMSPLIALPVGIIPSDYSSYDEYGLVEERVINRGLNLGGQFTLSVGKGFKINRGDLTRDNMEERFDMLMRNLASQLPENMQGHYRQMDP